MSDTSSTASDDDVASDGDWDDWGGGGLASKSAAAANANADDDADDFDETATVSLFDSNVVLPSASAALAHDAEKHGFDLAEFRKKLSLDDYGTFRVVNYIRSEVAAGRDPKPELKKAEEEGGVGGSGSDAIRRPWDDDAFLVPSNPEDPLLFYEYDDDEEDDDANHRERNSGVDVGPSSSSSDAAAIVARLRSENDALRSALASLAAASLPPEAATSLPPQIVEALRGVGWGGERDDGGAEVEKKEQNDSDDDKRLRLIHRRPSSPPNNESSSKQNETDEAYFDSYSTLDIHREMLSDEPRTGSYRRALERNPSTIKGATVLDVGAGTGVLSLFAARGGARAVVAVEASERVAALARQNAVANGFAPFSESAGASSSAAGLSDNNTTVTVVNSRVEDIERLPVSSDNNGGDSDHFVVDVLVSEWMGYALFFECMLDSVILARDRFLKKKKGDDGDDKAGTVPKVLPDRCSVFVAGVSPQASDLDFWKDVQGLDLSACARVARERRLKRGAVVAVEASHLETSESKVHELDLCTCEVGDEAFSAEFELAVLDKKKEEGGEEGEKKGNQRRLLGGVALWFDVEFSERVCPDEPVLLSTSPRAPQTHWHQALLELPESAMMELVGSSGCEESAGQTKQENKKLVSVVKGRVSLSRGPRCHRSVDVALEVQGFDSDGIAVPGARHVGLYPFSMSSD